MLQSVRIALESTIAEQIVMWLLLLVQPITGYMNSEPSGDMAVAVYRNIWEQFPIVSYMEEYGETEQYAVESDIPYSEEDLIRMIQEENDVEKSVMEESDMEESVMEESATSESKELLETQTEVAVEEEILTVQESTEVTGNEVIYMDDAGFIPAAEKSVTYTREQLEDIDFVKNNFYTEDATTQIQPEQLAYETLVEYDAALKQDNSQPQILIYHTHSQETFVDSDPARAETTIMGVGECLTRILRDQYGFHVIHHLGQYDLESRDYAYTSAAEGVEALLEQYPSIEVVIDLHRDAVPEDTKLVTTIQGKEMAKFMFFNGLSYTRELGELTSLPNPYVQDNLAFAFQMHLAAEEYYPGLTRKIYLKGYRYNMHYRPKSLLIELGAQTNTVEEAMNACEPLAHVIAMVLKDTAN